MRRGVLLALHRCLDRLLGAHAGQHVLQALCSAEHAALGAARQHAPKCWKRSLEHFLRLGIPSGEHRILVDSLFICTLLNSPCGFVSVSMVTTGQ